MILLAYFCTLSFIQQQHLLSTICKISFLPGDQCELWGAHTSPWGCTRAGPADILPLLSWGGTVPSHPIAPGIPGLTLKGDAKVFQKGFHIFYRAWELSSQHCWAAELGMHQCYRSFQHVIVIPFLIVSLPSLSAGIYYCCLCQHPLMLHRVQLPFCPSL